HAPPPYLYWRSPENALRVAAGMESSSAPSPGEDWRAWLRDSSVAETSGEVARIFTLAFDPGSTQDGPWEQFPGARIWRPAAMYAAEGDVEAFHGMSAHDVPAQDDVAEQASAFPHRGGIHIPARDDAQYRQRVAAGLDLLADGGLRKIVLARSMRVELDTAFDPLRALTSLQQAHTFGICYSPDGRHYFISATPERLARVRAGRFSTMALAGTLPHRQTGEAGRQELLENAKERAEHAYVTEMIREALAPFSAEMEVDDVRLLALPHITHILTRIEGQLDAGYGMLDVVSALHPTPAVAGTPRDAATAGIRALEDFSRGLYAGCIGWVDAAGNGDAAVAIRSAVAHERTAHAFAGAGIVAGSDPMDEEAETRAKLQTALDILGT
ncbi:MAG: isochorismate synthase, partial [Bacteroidota bacterium]|nr:isochorismate synthase [Bacteroidota bacterium]